jgi:hypothetical protein
MPYATAIMNATAAPTHTPRKIRLPVVIYQLPPLIFNDGNFRRAHQASALI